MISYEIAQKLKDAGFPQKLDEPAVTDDFSQVVNPKTYVYLPDLSELINACIPEGFILERVDGRWYAGKWVEIDEERRSMDSKSGLTPEEAVARLWLTLHGKDS